jgi:transposase
MLVEAAWAAAKAPGPLHAFFVRIRAKRGHQERDYLWARPALVANQLRLRQSPLGAVNIQLHYLELSPPLPKDER